MENETEPVSKPAAGRNWVLICIALLLFTATLRRLLRKPLHTIFLKLSTRLLHKFQNMYNQFMNKRKINLIFEGLETLAKAAKHPLDVVEIGAGCGANFAYYPKGTTVTCVEPLPEFIGRLREIAKSFPDVRLGEVHVGYAEDMSFIEDNSADAVVCTLVLCTVRDVDKCMSEVLRILKPGGKFFFMEHVHAEKGTFLNFLQRRLNFIWLYMADCDLTRRQHLNIKNAGFRLVECDLFDADEIVKPSSVVMGMPLLKSHASGVATK